MPSATPLRFTLDCHALPWQVLYFEESTSLARPPGMVLDVSTDRAVASVTEIERTTVSLLIEGPDGSRVVRGWVRHVERVGVVDSRVHLRLHLVPMAMAEHAPRRRVEAPAEPPALLAVTPAPGSAEAEWAVEPAMVAMSPAETPPPLEEQDVTAEHTPEQLRAMRGEDLEERAAPRPAPRPAAKQRREITEVVPCGDHEPAPRRRRAHEGSTPDGTRLVIDAEVDAALAQRRDQDRSAWRRTAERRPSSRDQVRTGATQLMSHDDLERLRQGAAPRQAARGGSGTERRRHAAPEGRSAGVEPPKNTTQTERLPLVTGTADQSAREGDRDEPRRPRRKVKRSEDDGTPLITWEELEALHRGSREPKT